MDFFVTCPKGHTVRTMQTPGDQVVCCTCYEDFGIITKFVMSDLNSKADDAEESAVYFEKNGEESEVIIK